MWTETTLVKSGTFRTVGTIAHISLHARIKIRCTFEKKRFYPETNFAWTSFVQARVVSLDVFSDASLRCCPIVENSFQNIENQADTLVNHIFRKQRFGETRETETIKNDGACCRCYY